MSLLNTTVALLVIAGISGQPAYSEEITAILPAGCHFLLPINDFVGHDSSRGNLPVCLSYMTPPAIPEPISGWLKPGSNPVVIDNDEIKETEMKSTAVWREMPDQAGKTQISTGGQFPVSLLTCLTSKNARIGDAIAARLMVDLKIGGRLIAGKGALVTGHVSSVEPARALLASELSFKRWMRCNGAIGLTFDQLISDSGDHLPLLAAPARLPRIVKSKAEGRVLGVNDRGQIVTPLSIQLKYQAIHLAIRGAASAGGVFSFGIIPVVYGAAGAICPTFAFGHPVGQSMRHRRIKGFALGVLTGLPGGFLISDSIVHGQEASLLPGDQFLAEFKQDFTGQAGTEAELVPESSKKVHGEVVRGKK